MATCDPACIDTLVLARLLVASAKAPREKEVVTSLERWLRAATAEPTPAAMVQASLARLRARALVDATALRLTAEGRAAAHAVLALPEGARPPKTWREASALVVTRALGEEGSGKERASKASADALRAAVVARRFGLPKDEARTAARALDAVAAREIGLGDKPFSLAHVRAHLLARALGLSGGKDPKRTTALAVARAADAASADAGALQEAIVRDWIRAAPPGPSAGAEPSPPAASATLALDSFAKEVLKAATATTDGRCGRHKLLVASLWNRVRREPAFAGLDERAFKDRLLDAHRAQLLTLSRADLTDTIANDALEASQIDYLNATFHLVQLPEVSV